MITNHVLNLYKSRVVSSSLLNSLQNWSSTSSGTISKTFSFPSFKQATRFLSFANVYTSKYKINCS